MKKHRKSIVAFIIIFSLLFLIPIWSVKFLPLQDWPVFTGFSYIISHFSDFSSSFSVKPVPPPYLAGFLMLAGLMKIFHPLTAGKILLSIYIAAFLWTFYYYLRNLNPDCLFLWFFAPLLVFNNFFAKGNINFILSIPIFLFAVPFTLKKLNNFRWYNLLIIFFFSLILYFTHLFTYLVFLLVLLIVVLIKKKGVSFLGSSFVPLISFIGYFFINRAPADIHFHTSFLQKFMSFRDMFGTWTPYSDVAILFLPFLLLFILVVKGWGTTDQQWKVVFFSLIFFYVISPTEVYTLMRPDQRFLVFTFFILLLFVGFAKSSKIAHLFPFLLVLLSIFNIVRKEKVFLELQPTIKRSVKLMSVVPKDYGIVTIGTSKYYIGVINPFVNLIAYNISLKGNINIPSYDWNVPLFNKRNYPRPRIENNVIKNTEQLFSHYDYFFVMEKDNSYEKQLEDFTEPIVLYDEIKLFKKKK
jgi:hypothetical protein